MRRKPVGSGFASVAAHRIRIRETRKDIRALDRAENLSGSLREEYVRTKEHVNGVLDDSREDSTQYAVDRSEETAEVTAYESKEQILKGKEKIRQHVKKQSGKHTETEAFRKSAKKGSYQPHRSVDPVQQTDKQELVRAKKPTIKSPGTSEPITRQLPVRKAGNSSVSSKTKATEPVKTIKTTTKSSGRATIKTAEHYGIDFTSGCFYLYRS